MPMNVGEAITPALTHTSRLLFRPFALRKWLALGLVSMFAGMGGGGANSRFNNWPSDNSGNMDEIGRSMGAWITGHIALIVLGVILLFVISLVFSWLGSVFKFVYLNQITRSPAAIREPFRQFIGIGTSFFLWEIAFSVVLTLVVVVLIALPVVGAFIANTSLAVRIIAVAWAVIVGLAVIAFASVTSIFARDFVLSTMFVRGVKVIEAWHMVIPIVRANAGQSVLYILLLMVI